MARKPVANKAELEKRFRKFIGHASKKWPTMWQVLWHIRKDVGPVALFGGALRDWSLGKPIQPRDFDFVVESDDPRALQNVLAHFSLSRNNFSGYRVQADSQIDIWRLEDTWAFKHSAAKMEDGFASLIHTTFLNSDAIAYDISREQLYVHESFMRFHATGELDLILEKNPNPAGAAVRALRLALLHKFSLSPRLVKFIADQRDRIDDDGLKHLANSIFHFTVDFECILDVWRNVQAHSAKLCEHSLPLDRYADWGEKWRPLHEPRYEEMYPHFDETSSYGSF